MSALLHTPGKHFLVKSYTAFCSMCSPHTIACQLGRLLLPGGGQRARFVRFSIPAKRMREGSGASAPSTCCSLFRVQRALHTVFVPLHFRGHHQVRLMDPPRAREDLLYSLEMLKSLLHPVALNSTAVVRGVFSQGPELPELPL